MGISIFAEVQLSKVLAWYLSQKAAVRPWEMAALMANPQAGMAPVAVAALAELDRLAQAPPALSFWSINHANSHHRKRPRHHVNHRNG